MNFCSAVTDDTPRHNTNAANRAEFCWTMPCLAAEDGELMAGYWPPNRRGHSTVRRKRVSASAAS